MSRSDTLTTTSFRRYHLVLGAAFIFVATMMTFVNSVHADFVNWDDEIYVTGNPLVQNLSLENIGKIFSHSYYHAWTPMTLLSHSVDVAVWGMKPKGHHLTNIVIHSSNAVLLFFVCLVLFDASRNMAGDKRAFLERLTPSIMVGSAVGAMLFAMHPQRVESVAWVSGRKDLLCAFFLLPSLGTYVRWKVTQEKLWFVVSLSLFTLAVMSKSVAASFPLVLIVADFWLTKKKSPQQTSFVRLLKDKIPFLITSVIVSVLTILAASGGRVNPVAELNSFERIMLPMYSLCFYVWKLIVPLNLSPVYPELERGMLYLAPAVLVAVCYGCMVLWDKGRFGVTAAVLSYALMLLPTFLGLHTGMQPLADRYSYLSLLSIYMLVGGCIEWLWRKSASSPGKMYQREMLALLLLTICALSAYRTVRHTLVWHNSVALWTQALRVAPDTEAEFDKRRPYMKPSYLDARINLGTALYGMNEKDKAWENFSAVLAFDSCNADAHYNLGMLLIEGGDATSSERAFSNAIMCDSMYAKAYHNLGALYADRDSVASVEMLRRAARLGFAESQALLRKRGTRW